MEIYCIFMFVCEGLYVKIVWMLILFGLLFLMCGLEVCI